VSFYWQTFRQEEVYADPDAAAQLTDLLKQYRPALKRMMWSTGGGNEAIFEALSRAETYSQVYSALEEARKYGHRFVREDFREVCALPPAPVSVEQQLESGLEEL
jgi:hypothetical protein